MATYLPIAGLTLAGRKAGKLFAEDARIAALAEEKYGFITTSPDAFRSDMAMRHIAVAGGQLPEVSALPDDAIMASLLDGLS